MRRVRLGRDLLVLAPAEQGCEGAEEPGRVAERPVALELEREQVLAQEDDRLGPAQDPDVRGQAQLERVFADQPVAERVERPDRGVRVAVRDELVDPDLHLGRGLLGERQGENLGRPRPTARDQPGDPPRDHLGLPGSGPGHDEERAVAMRDRFELFRIESAEQRVEAGRWIARWRRGAIGQVAVPDGDLLEGNGLATEAWSRHRIAEGSRIRGHDTIIVGPRAT